MKIIAVTGGIGSGKSLVCKEFGRLGAVVFDTDKISHEIMRKGGSAYDETTACFGTEILNSDGEINRKKLADIVFSDKDKLNKLNSITHRLIYKELSDRINNADGDAVCVEIPLLFTAPCPVRIDLSVAVIADRELRIQRVVGRDLCTRAQAEARMDSQLSDEKLAEYADCVILNNGDLNEVRRKTEEIYSRLIGI